MAQAAAPWIAKELLCGQSVAALDMATEDTATTAREPVTTASPSPPCRPMTPGQLPGRPAEDGKVLGRDACSPDHGRHDGSARPRQHARQPVRVILPPVRGQSHLLGGLPHHHLQVAFNNREPSLFALAKLLETGIVNLGRVEVLWRAVTSHPLEACSHPHPRNNSLGAYVQQVFVFSPTAPTTPALPRPRLPPRPPPSWRGFRWGRAIGAQPGLYYRGVFRPGAQPSAATRT